MFMVPIRILEPAVLRGTGRCVLKSWDSGCRRRRNGKLHLGLGTGRLMASVGMAVCLIATDGFRTTAVVRHIFHACSVRTLLDYSTFTGMCLNGATIGTGITSRLQILLARRRARPG